MTEFLNPFQLPTAIERQAANPVQPAMYTYEEAMRMNGVEPELVIHLAQEIASFAAPQQEKRKPGRPKKLQKIVKA